MTGLGHPVGQEAPVTCEKNHVKSPIAFGPDSPEKGNPEVLITINRLSFIDYKYARAGEPLAHVLQVLTSNFDSLPSPKKVRL